MTIYISQNQLWDLYFESEMQFRYYAILSDKYKKIKFYINIGIGFLVLLELYFIHRNHANPMDSHMVISIIGFIGTLPGFLINLKTIDKSFILTNATVLWNQARRDYKNLYNRLLNHEKIEMAEVERVQKSLQYTEIITITITQDDNALKKATTETKSYLKPFYEDN